jgi:hypothetical protein
MPGRLLCCLVLIAACWPTRTACAQAYPWARGAGYLNAEMPLSVANQNPYAGQATYYPNWGNPPYGGGSMWPNDMVDGDAYGNPGHLGYPDAYGLPPGTGPYGDQIGGQYGTPFRPAPVGRDHSHSPEPGIYPCGNTTYEALPSDRGWLYDEDIAHLRAAFQAARGSYLRIDYLSWQIENPGNTLLGAPLANVQNPRQPFVVQADDGLGNLVDVGTARVMDMSPIDLRNTQGSRIVLGVPLADGGEFDLSFYGIQSMSELRAAELLTPPTATPTNPNAVFVATSLLEDGLPGSLLILYDRDFQVKYKVTNWGMEANSLIELGGPPTGGVRTHGIVGFRYTGHLEELIQRGSFDNRSDLDFSGVILDPPINNKIYSETRNRVYGLQLGLRSEYSNKYYAVGIEPKVTLGANTYFAQVETNNLRDFDGVQDDGRVKTTLRDTNFSPTFDVGVYARANLNDWLSLQVGYNFLWMSNIARADQVVYYNDTGLVNPPAVVVRPAEESLWMQGISVGGQILLP